MKEPMKMLGGKLRSRLSRKLRFTGLLAMGLGLTVSAAASPNLKHETAASKGKHGWLQTGTASWYGGKFNGRSTATGEIYNMHAFTCAHRTLPLGTWIRVTNIHNKRSVVIRVNDRGPMSPRFIVDLSYGAAQKLGIEGIGKVRIEQVNPSLSPEVARQLVAQLKIPNDPSVWQPVSTEPSRQMLSMVEDR